MVKVGYRHAGPVLVRASSYPDGLALPDPPNLDGPAQEAETRGLAWLAAVWQHPQVQHAVEAANPVLFMRIADALAGRPDPRMVLRLVRSLALYLLRWRGRATPFGLFAGVAPARVGRQVAVTRSGQHRASARVDALWLADVIDRLEQDPRLLHRLPVVANRAACLRAGWLVFPAAAGADPGAFAPVEVGVRATGPVRAAVAAAGEPVALADLIKQLAVEYPSTAVDQIRDLVVGLVRCGALVTSLRAPATVVDALQHLREELGVVDAADLPEVAALVNGLAAIAADLDAHATADPAVAATVRARTTARMDALTGIVGSPLLLDLAVDYEVTLPAAVIAEAETTASALLRLTPYPFGYPHWKQFHTRFRRRYGPGAVVAVRDLVADSGLGYPAGYLSSPVRPTVHVHTARDRALIALIQQATIDGHHEVELTEPLIRALCVEPDMEMMVPDRVELAFQIHAQSCEQLSRGRFRLAVTSVSRPASSMAGRFLHLLPGPERDRWADTFRPHPSADGVVAAQLSFPPRQRRDENVARTPRLLPNVVSLGEYRDSGPGHIEVDDLGVYADARHLYLVQLSTGRRVEIRVPHALDGRVHTPPLARFLAEVGSARHAAYRTFDWGIAAQMPFLPSLRLGRTVLTPARWLLHRHDLPAARTDLAAWTDAFTGWRHRWRVPATVAWCRGDQRLPLDLDEPAHRDLIRASLDRMDVVELREAPDPADLGWFGGAHEILIPLRSTSPRESAGGAWTYLAARPVATVSRAAAELPGGSLMYARIEAHPQRHNDILTEHLPSLVDGWSELAGWWYGRFRDPARPEDIPRLDLYLRLSTADAFGDAAARLGDWASQLREHGLLSDLQLATQHPQTGRYGHGPAIAAAEQALAADSAAAIAQIRYADRTGIPLVAVTAASLVNLATCFAGTRADGLRWLIEHLPHEPATADRTVRDQTLRLTAPNHTWTTQPDDEPVRAAWERRAAALAIYRESLTAQRDPLPVLRSLLHQHTVRVLDKDPDIERVTNRLARAAALRWTPRTKP